MPIRNIKFTTTAHRMTMMTADDVTHGLFDFYPNTREPDNRTNRIKNVDDRKFVRVSSGRLVCVC